MLLVVNAGSSSVKLALFEGERQLARAAVDRIGVGGPAGHAEALAEGLKQMGVAPAALTAAAHRVVHGGARFTRATRITPEVLDGIEACAMLAPLHNPANLIGICAVAALAPNLPQYATFDTAFHATNPEVAVTYALPEAERDRGLRRYGFHGLSYASLVRNLAHQCGGAVPDRLLALHLGNGASLCAIRNGQSVATTMGYSPLDGLTMGTRAGGLDPAIVVDLCRHHGADAAMRLLNRDCGLQGLAGASDMRTLHAAKTPQAEFAVAHFCYWIIRHAGSMIAALGGIDAIAFTGGIGENDLLVRERILTGLHWIGVSFDRTANAENAPRLDPPGAAMPVHVIRADEERQIAIEARAVKQEM